MNKKTLVIYIASAVILLAGIVAGVAFLYRGEGSGHKPMSRSEIAEQFPLLQAVPSDAAAIFCSGSLKDGVSLFTDGTKAFDALVPDGRRDAYGHFFKTLDSGIDDGLFGPLRSQEMAVSLHYSGSIVPLVVINVPRTESDSTSLVIALSEAAAEAGMKSSFHSSDDISAVLVSTSETIINSSIRHQEEGQSILSDKSFVPALAGVGGKDVLFFSNAYADKLLPVLFQKPVTRHSDFIKSIASWTVLSLADVRENTLDIDGYLSSGKAGDHFVNVFSGARQETSSFIKVVPSGTFFAVSVPMGDYSEYLENYRKYLDSKSRLGTNNGELAALGRKVGKNPDDWAKSLSVKEVAKAQWRSGESLCEAVFVRVGRKDYSIIFNGLDAEDEKTYRMAPNPYSYPGFASSLFGKLFSVQDESCFAFTGEWIVSGSENAISDFVGRFTAGDVLQALLTDASAIPAGLSKDCSFAAYFSVGASPAGSIFSQDAVPSVNSTMDGAAYEPCFVICNGDGFKFDVTRVPFITKASTPAVASDAVVEIPSGPFPVKNSATGRTNLLAQQSNYYLSLKEEDGTGIWSIPFTEPLCGAVETIDYYANGKLQFLFAAGTKIHLLDRLGRFVSGFPVDLGKEILLGPAAYDFSGAKGYSVVVLHKDNSIGMYNIHGEKPEGWKGIAPGEMIISLPELLKAGGKDYWAVRTAVRTLIYPFYGGEPVYSEEGAKSIRRDSAIEIDGESLKVTCNDGKTRNIKL